MTRRDALSKRVTRTSTPSPSTLKQVLVSDGSKSCAIVRIAGLCGDHLC